MKLNKRVELGIRAVEELYTYGDNYVHAKDLAETIGTTKTFLEQILYALKNANIVEVKRGRQGGCKVIARATAFSAYEVATALGYDFRDRHDGHALSILSDRVETAWKNVSLYSEANLKRRASNG